MFSTLNSSTFVFLSLLALLTHAGSGGGDSSSTHDSPVRFEEIPNSHLKRVILTEKAVERLGIEVGAVSEKVIVRTQFIGGSLVLPVVQKSKTKPKSGLFSDLGNSFSSSPAQFVSSTEADPNFDWVRVTLSKAEWNRLDKTKPARILPLSTRNSTDAVIMAIPSDLPPIEDAKRSMLRVHYKISGKNHGLKLNDRVRVELPLSSSGERSLVVPYDSVHYDGSGNSWVYSNPKSLIYERKPISIERIEGEFAVLSAGPDVGTIVVTVGAALLYGAEVIFKK